MRFCELKLYRGYANDRELVISGHAFRKYPSSENLYNRKGFRNIRSIIQLFTVKTLPNIRVVFEFGSIRSELRTEADGFFRFRLPLTAVPPPGWHSCKVILDDASGPYYLEREGEFLVPGKRALLMISDIDDTFLVSHSVKPLKKLYVMLMRNVASRKFYADVVAHYRMLESAGTAMQDGSMPNPFFYVSSSEWNLYDYIVKFTQLSELPKAVIKLKKIKDNLDDFLNTGAGDHMHKLRKIEHILEFYPEWSYILLGDDGQMDPYIYETVATHHADRVRAVYIRQTRGRARKKVKEIMSRMEEKGIAVCYFRTSGEAIRHSIQEGIIQEGQLAQFPVA